MIKLIGLLLVACIVFISCYFTNKKTKDDERFTNKTFKKPNQKNKKQKTNSKVSKHKTQNTFKSSSSKQKNKKSIKK
tara:strand:+ start:1664 stop:1894 length:231 start_codon:yes stop_codon:yes gene_type:complete